MQLPLPRRRRTTAPVRSLLLCNMAIMLVSGRSARFAVQAWMPRTTRSCRHQQHDNKQLYKRTAHHLLVLRGGSEHHRPQQPFAPVQQQPQQQHHSFLSSTTSLAAAATSSETEAAEYAASLCGDELTVKAASDFGGLKYWNTGIDHRFRVLFVLGGPGAGKGTQSELMEENYPVAHFSVGELLRNVPADSPHKATIEKSLVAGQIVPVEMSLALLQAAMQDATARVGKHALFLVDGFPRNFDNLSGWCRVMSKDVAALESVLVYQCPLPVLQERILERAKTSGRDDDNLESVKKRFRTFETETVPVVDMLRTVAEQQQRWSVVDIAGDQPLEDVWMSTQQVLNQLILQDVLSANAALLAAVQAGDVQAYESLCDADFFAADKDDVALVMGQQEGSNDSNVQRAEVDVITGKQVAVSYDRLIDGILVREKRFWSHQGADGWRNVHFVRTPAADSDLSSLVQSVVYSDGTDATIFRNLASQTPPSQLNTSTKKKSSSTSALSGGGGTTTSSSNDHYAEEINAFPVMDGDDSYRSNNASFTPASIIPPRITEPSTQPIEATSASSSNGRPSEPQLQTNTDDTAYRLYSERGDTEAAVTDAAASGGSSTRERTSVNDDRQQQQTKTPHLTIEVDSSYVAMKDSTDSISHGSNYTATSQALYNLMTQPSRVFLQDNVADMTWSRRIALANIHRQWYNPYAKDEARLIELAEEASRRGPEARSPKVTREEIPSLEKAWAYYEHFALPRYLVEENQDMNHLEVAEPGDTKHKTALYDPIFTPLSQMGDFGLGFGLYFFTLVALAALTFFAGILNIPNFIYFSSREYSNGQEGLEMLLRGSAMCTNTEWVPCIDCDPGNFAPNRYYNIAVAGDDDGAADQQVVFTEKNNCDGATLQQGLVNYATLVVIVIGIVIMNWYQTKMEVVFDEDEQTAQDYSVRIKNPPKDATDPEEWRRFFKDNFHAHATVITIALNNDDLINALRERRECIRKIELSVEPGTSLAHLNLARMSAEAQRNRSLLDRLWAKAVPGFPELFGRKAELEAQIAGWAQLDFPCTDVFLSFETESDQRRVLSALSIGKLDVRRNATHKVEPLCLFRGNHVLAATEPDEPNTVRWSDLNLSLTDRLKPLATTTICSVIIIFLIALLIRAIHARSVFFAANAIALFNCIFPYVAKELTHMERHQSEGHKQTSLYFKIAAFRWVNTAIIITIITPFTATLETDDGVIPTIYAIFFAEIVTTNVLQLVDLGGNFERHILAPRATTQDAMNLAMQGQEVDLAERYTNMTKILFLALWYCSIFPAALFMCSFALIVNYYTDKYCLFRIWKRQPHLGTQISTFSNRYFFPSAIVAMATLSSYYWSGFPFDNLCQGDEEIPDQFIGTHYFAVNGEAISVTLAEGDLYHRYCSQDELRYWPPSFPALSIWQPEGDEWMSSDQEFIVNLYGLTSGFVILLALMSFAYMGYRFVLGWFKGKYEEVGSDQGINYSEVKCISAYIPQVKSTMYSYPLLACDVGGNSSLLDWTDPERPHSFYDLAQDADELIGELNVQDKQVFSILSHCPPSEKELSS